MQERVLFRGFLYELDFNVSLDKGRRNLIWSENSQIVACGRVEAKSLLVRIPVFRRRAAKGVFGSLLDVTVEISRLHWSQVRVPEAKFEQMVRCEARA